MPLQPRERDLPRIPGRLRLYQITSITTGTFLLLLCAEMILKYWMGYEIEAGGPFGFLALVARDTVTAVNVSTLILIVHGWFYVIYLFAGFRMWSVMRWNIGWLLLIALGGIVPFLSFFLEIPLVRRARAQISGRAVPAAAPPITNAEVETSH